ncbi:MAG: AraC family transcriptional regulator [Clostridiaceae bacterium]
MEQDIESVPVKWEYLDKVSDFELELKVADINTPVENLIHFHESFEIIFYIKSQNKAYINDIAYDLNSNDILIIPPRQIHSIQYTPSIPYMRYVLYFSCSFIQSTLDTMGCSDILSYFESIPYKKITLNPASINHFSQLFHLFYQQRKKMSSYKELPSSPILIAYTITLLIEIYEQFKICNVNHAVQTEQTPITEKIIKYINRNYAENINLKDLENAFFVSKYYICRLFHENLGVSVIEYLQYKRIIEAQKLLDDTDRPIIDICFNCGFNNIQHFYRVFKKISQMTPQQYRTVHQSHDKK